MKRKLIIIAILFSYCIIFFHQEKDYDNKPPCLTFPMPAKIQKFALGYLRQIGSEMHFIKTSIFLGNHRTVINEKQANSLFQNFDVMSDLHPYFLDIYFLCQSYLPYLGEDKVRETN